MEKAMINDKIRGCLMAGAAGDALGYPVERLCRHEIISHFGPSGLMRFYIDGCGKALVSDDTQLSLYTANGLLMGQTRFRMRGIGAEPWCYVKVAYGDWYKEQTPRGAHGRYTWLSKLPEMSHNRGAGPTTIEACRALSQGREVSNNSKGSGGIMRVAPMGLFGIMFNWKREMLAEGGAEVARATHKHPLGFLPAALLTLVVHDLAVMDSHEAKRELVHVVENALATLDGVYAGKYAKHKAWLVQLTHEAMRLALLDVPDLDAIRRLGRGWTADETWAIALYCALRHIDSPREALIAAVNHSGDSDTVASVTGNIVGAMYGYRGLGELNRLCPPGMTLADTLELGDVILAIADDLTTGCIICEFDFDSTAAQKQWFERYCDMEPAGINMAARRWMSRG